MKKRNKIIMLIGCLLLITVLVFISLDGSFLSKKYDSVWSDKYIEGLENDQSKIIAYGIRAASSHNTQPWLVKAISTDTIELYADMGKALHVVDGDYKQLRMSQGTFIESYKQGALEYGYDVEVNYSIPNFDDKMPLIATIKMHEGANMDSVDVTSSATYDAVYSKRDTDLRKTLDECIAEYPGFNYTIVESNSDVEKLESVLMEGTIIESKDEEATKELIDVFRWTEWEKNEYRYGLSLNTMSGVLKPFIQPIMKSSSNNWEAFGDSSITQFKDRLDKQTKYILIKSDNPSNFEYIYSGQIYQKLIFEISDYDLRPAMQVLENFEAMKSLNMQFQQEYGNNGVVVLIIGMQEKTGNSTNSNPRQLVEDIIIQQH